MIDLVAADIVRTVDRDVAQGHSWTDAVDNAVGVWRYVVDTAIERGLTEATSTAA